MKTIRETIEPFFSNTIKKNGPTAAGVEWNSREGRLLRFEQLIKIIDASIPNFSLTDFGCGYGELYAYLNKKFPMLDYRGLDFSQSMIETAQNFLPEIASHFICSDKIAIASDYTVASGIFNLRFDISNADWLTYILETLNHMYEMSVKGFSFNCLTHYADLEYCRNELYYSDPNFLFDYCKKHFSRYVALLHDYPLYEFTILVKK